MEPESSERPDQTSFPGDIYETDSVDVDPFDAEEDEPGYAARGQGGYQPAPPSGAPNLPYQPPRVVPTGPNPYLPAVIRERTPASRLPFGPGRTARRGALPLGAWWVNLYQEWAAGRLSVAQVWTQVRRRVRWWPNTARYVEVDHRDRIGIATWLVVLGLGTSLLLQLPTIELSFWALGSPVSIPLTGTVLSALFLAVIAAAGAEGVVTVHPSFANRRVRTRTWSFWTLPMAITIISVVLMPLAPSPVIQVLALLVSGALLSLAYLGIFATVEPGRPGFRRARLVLDALAYGSALLLFLFVYQTRTRSLLSGTLVAVTAVLLAAEILRSTTDRSSTALTYGGIIGLILGQVTWALNYWVLPGLTGGLLLLLIFYLLVGIAQQGLQGRLTQRVLLEFGIFGAVALVLIALVGPGF